MSREAGLLLFNNIIFRNEYGARIFQISDDASNEEWQVRTVGELSEAPAEDPWAAAGEPVIGMVHLDPEVKQEFL